MPLAINYANAVNVTDLCHVCDGDCDCDGNGDGVGGRSKCTTQQQQQQEQQQQQLQPAVGYKTAQTMPFTDGISNTINY